MPRGYRNKDGSKLGFKKGCLVGELNPAWKGGISRDSDYRNRDYHREYRHRKGISERYISKYSDIELSEKEIKKRNNQAYKRRVRVGGKLSIKIVQQIYEDNIKKYGTLTCYLCLKPIEFGQDCLEHKIPLSRDGTNQKENLAIAHRSCNTKKYNRTETEFRKKYLPIC